MKKTTRKRKVREPEEPWADALDVNQFDRTLARMIKELRRKRHLNLSRVERRSGITRQGWRKVEKRECSPTSHSDVLICNALRLRPSVLMRMVEDWLDRRLQALAAMLLPLLELLPESALAIGV